MVKTYMRQTNQFRVHKITKQSNKNIKNNPRKRYVKIPHQVQSKNTQVHTEKDQIINLMFSKVNPHDGCSL